MSIGRNHTLLLALAISAVAIMVAQPIAIGFASPSSYTATTACTGNNVSANYFTVGLYVYTGGSTDDVIAFNSSTFRLAGSNPFNNDDDDRMVTYTKNGSTYTVNDGTSEMCDGSLFLVVHANNHYSNSFTVSSYDVDGFSECGFTNGTATLTWGGGTPIITGGYGYKLSLILSDLDYSSSDIPSLEITVTITVTDGCNGTHNSQGNTVSFKYVSPMEDLVNELEEINEDFLDSGMAFVADSEGAPPGIFIQNANSNTNSIATGDTGNNPIRATVTIPSDVYFCIYISISDADTWISHSEVTVNVKKINTTTQQQTTLGSISFNKEGSSLYLFLTNNGTLTSGSAPPTDKTRYIHCEEGETLSISFTGTQKSNWFGYGSQTMTVSAKLVQWIDS